MLTSKALPYLPASVHRAVFEKLHGPSHRSIRGSHRLVAHKFVWPNRNVDVGKYSRACVAYQRSKVQRLTVAPFPSAGRFEYIRLEQVPSFFGWHEDLLVYGGQVY